MLNFEGQARCIIGEVQMSDPHFSETKIGQSYLLPRFKLQIRTLFVPYSLLRTAAWVLLHPRSVRSVKVLSCRSLTKG